MKWLYVLFVCATARRHKYPFRNNNNENANIEKLINPVPNLDDGDITAVFPPLKNTQHGAYLAKEDEHLWIARVIHSRTSIHPYMCTASCISHNIFITAATCVARLKINHTTVIYNGYWLHLKAIVLPANPSRQGFDDIGFLVTSNIQNILWHTATLYVKENRTDKNWISRNFKDNGWNHRVVGFSSPSSENVKDVPEKIYALTGLEVIVHYDLCPSFLTRRKTTIYDVPCYSGCYAGMYSIKKGELTTEKDYCNWFHQVIGSALLEKSTGNLIGVSTWGAGLGKLPLPVGFSVPNSDNYYKNYRCAIEIRDDKSDPSPGHFQTLCKN